MPSLLHRTAARTNRGRTRLACLAAISMAGCASYRPPPAPAFSCPGVGEQTLEVPLGSLDGVFHISARATRGPGRGEQSSGYLWLEPMDSNRRQARDLASQPVPGASHPIFGATSLDLEELGLPAEGLLSRDPAAPGVLLSVSRASGTSPPRASFTFGSATNRLLVRAWAGDIPLTRFRLQWARTDGFGGTWASVLWDTVAAGEFCARRLTDSVARR